MTQTAFCYKTGDYHIVLEAGIRSELLTSDTIYPIPFAPEWCLGLISAHGELYPVLDMHGILLNASGPEKPRLLWLQHPEFAPVVISCEGLPRQIELPSAAAEQARLPGLPGWIRQTWLQDDELLLSADHARLFRTLIQQSH